MHTTATLATRQEIEVAVTEAGTTAKQMHNEALTLVVDCPPAYEYAVELLRRIRTRRKDLEEARLKITRPIDQAKVEVMNLFRPYESQLKADEETVDEKAVTWRRDEERRRQEEETRLRQEEQARLDREREATTKKADKLEAQGKPEQAELVRAAVPEAAPLPVVESAVPKVKGSAARTDWKFEILDATKIPREYLVPDEVKIGRVVRALGQATNIPGVRVYAKESTAVRRG